MFNWFKKKIKYVSTPPLPEKKIIVPSMFTPDIAFLESMQEQLLFVCDDWMRDRRANFVLDDEQVIREGVAFSMPKFDFRVFTGDYSDDRVAIPVRVKNPFSGEGFRIKGEVVRLSPSTFLRLDKIRQNGIQFSRKRIRIIKPYRDEIVFENTTDLRQTSHSWHGQGVSNTGIDWKTGKFPNGHPLAGKKRWVSHEKLTFLWAWMYTAIPAYWNQYSKSPFLFEKVPTFKPKKDKWWLSEYYKYQNPKE